MHTLNSAQNEQTPIKVVHFVTFSQQPVYNVTHVALFYSFLKLKLKKEKRSEGAAAGNSKAQKLLLIMTEKSNFSNFCQVPAAVANKQVQGKVGGDG